MQTDFTFTAKDGKQIKAVMLPEIGNCTANVLLNNEWVKRVLRLKLFRIGDKTYEQYYFRFRGRTYYQTREAM